MADFGLAAQIGRMGGGAAGPAPVDPTNRMLQLMQLQQLQQNMMLARQQEGRAAQQFPLTLEGLREGINTERARQGLVGAQTRTAREQAASAERGGSAETGALDYIRTTPPEERANQARLDALRQSNPGAFQLVTDQINKAREVQAKAEEAGYSAMRKRFELQQTALAGMSSLLPAVTNERNYATLYQDFKAIDPTGARLIGPEFTPENMTALRARIQDLGDLEYKEDAFGRPYTLNKRTGKMEMLPPMPGPATAAPGAQMGVAPGAFSPPVMAASDAARAAAGTPIIQPRAGVPAAPEGLEPRAAAEFANVAARETAQAQVKAAEEERTKARTKGEFQATLDDVTRNYRKLGEMGVLITPQTEPVQRVKTFLASQAPGVAGVISPEVGGPMQAIQNLRQSLVSSLMGATGMTAKQIDSNAEMKAYLDSLTSPGQTADAIVDTFNAMSRRFGLNRELKVEDLTGATRERPQARSERRGATATPALGAQDREALNWANANPNDPRAAAIKQRLGVQ